MIYRVEMRKCQYRKKSDSNLISRVKIFNINVDLILNNEILVHIILFLFFFNCVCVYVCVNTSKICMNLYIHAVNFYCKRCFFTIIKKIRRS